MCKHPHRCVCICVCLCLCVCMHLCLCVCASMCVLPSVCVHLPLCVCSPPLCVCVCVCVLQPPTLTDSGRKQRASIRMSQYLLSWKTINPFSDLNNPDATPAQPPVSPTSPTSAAQSQLAAVSPAPTLTLIAQIGRASGRERV